MRISILILIALLVPLTVFAEDVYYGGGTIESVADYISDNQAQGAHSIDINHNVDVAVIAGKGGTVTIVDVSDPANLIILDSIISNIVDAQDVRWIDDRYCWIGSADEWLVLDLNNPSNLIINQDVEDDHEGALNGSCIYDFGTRTYIYSANKGVGESNGGICIYNVTTPSAVTFVGEYKDAGNDSPHDCEITTDGANLVYVCKNSDPDYHLVLLDLTDPEAPTLAGSVNNSNAERNNQLILSADDNYAFTVSTEGNCTSFDISTPVTPVYSNHVVLSSLYGSYGIWRNPSGYLYCGGDDNSTQDNGRVYVVDASDPTNLNEVQEFEDSSLDGAHQCQIIHGHLIVAAGGTFSGMENNVTALLLSDIMPWEVITVSDSSSVSYTDNLGGVSSLDTLSMQDVVTVRGIWSCSAIDRVVIDDSIFTERGNCVFTNTLLRNIITP